METPDDHARWKVIAPFLPPLRTVAYVELDQRVRQGHLQSVCAGLVLTLLPEISAEDQRSLRTAVELLHTLWTLDRDAWRSAITEGVGIGFPNSIALLEPDETPHVVVSVKHDKYRSQIQNHMRWRGLFAPNATLASAKALLLEEYGGSDHQIPQKIPMVLQFLVFGVATSMVEGYLSSTVDMVEAMQFATAKPSSPFELVWIDLDLSHYSLTARRGHQVAQLQALGIPFRWLSLRLSRGNDIGDFLSTIDCDQLWTTLLNTRTHQTNTFVEKLVIGKIDVDQFAPVCTVLEATEAVKSLHLVNVFSFEEAAARSEKWRVLARTLLAPGSQSSMKHLELQQGEFERSDVEDVQAALDAVEREDSGGDHALETFVIQAQGSSDETIEAIPALVMLMGTNLRCLSLHLWIGSFSTAAVREILNACRQLELLDISSVNLDSFDVFLDAYDSADCKIRSLSLHEVQVHNVHITAFARAMTDPRRRCTQVIQELLLDAVGSQNSLDAANLGAFLHVLRTNNTLEYLELQSPEPFLSTYGPLFKVHDQTWLPRASLLVPIASKTAFLSLTRPIRGSSREDSEPPALSHAITALDDRVVSLIFQFAATPAKRTVVIA